MNRTQIFRSSGLKATAAGDMVRFTREQAGWEWMSFSASRHLPGETITLDAQGEEIAVVFLSGLCRAEWGMGEYSLGGRENVFDGLPWALYLPSGSRARFTAETVLELAVCSVPSEEKLDPVLITPDTVATGLRGGENVSRQIVDLIPLEFPAHRLIAFEVYTPGGNWSSFPPHKHEEDRMPEEADLDEIYYYRLRDGKGFAVQNLYSPHAGRDEMLKVRDSDTVLVHEGYHPVIAGPGYDTYYLNFLAGRRREMAVTEDPEHVWLKNTWKSFDPRLPMVRLR